MPITARNIGKTVLLTIVTLGIYSYYWVYKTHEELKQSTGEGLGGGIGFLIYFLVAPVTFFLLAGEVQKAAARAGKPTDVTPILGLWFLLPIIGWYIWYSKVQRTLNDLSSQPVPA
jgi:hypothetical protein